MHFYLGNFCTPNNTPVEPQPTNLTAYGNDWYVDEDNAYYVYWNKIIFAGKLNPNLDFVKVGCNNSEELLLYYTTCITNSNGQIILNKYVDLYQSMYDFTIIWHKNTVKVYYEDQLLHTWKNKTVVTDAWVTETDKGSYCGINFFEDHKSLDILIDSDGTTTEYLDENDYNKRDAINDQLACVNCDKKSQEIYFQYCDVHTEYNKYYYKCKVEQVSDTIYRFDYVYKWDLNLAYYARDKAFGNLDREACMCGTCMTPDANDYSVFIDTATGNIAKYIYKNHIDDFSFTISHGKKPVN